MTGRTFEDLLRADLTRLAMQFGGSLSARRGHDPERDMGDAWRGDTWADDVLRRGEKTEEGRAS